MLIRQYGDYIPLFENIPRIFMPVFWVEQKFLMDAGKASQIRFALNLPSIGRITGIFLLVIGLFFISASQLRKILCPKEKSSNLLSKIEANGKGAVIKDYEMNPLMTKTELLQSCCK